MAQSKKPSSNAKSKKPGFQIPKLTETQWSMVGGAVIFVGYLLYAFVIDVPATTAPAGLTAPVKPSNVETAEQKFKRENKNINLPDGSAIPQKTIDEETKLTQQVPFGDKEVEFRVRLPKNWFMSEFARYGLPGEENYNVLTNIARYFGPAIEDARPYLWVEAERMKRYMTAETWARAYMIKRGISPEALKVDSEKSVQALYVDVRDLQSYAVRSLFRVEGDTMIITSYGVPVRYFKDFKDMMGLTLNSFELVHPINKQIEEIKDYKLLNVIKFKYYASWKPTREFTESTLRPSVELHNPQTYNNPKGELLQGLVLVNVFRKTSQFSPVQNMQVIMDRLGQLRMVIKAPLEPPKELPVRDSYIKIVQTPYLAQVDTYVRTDQFDIIKSEQSKTQQEIWMTTLDNDYYVAYVTLITPLQGTNYITWAQNMAAYELLIKSLELRTAPTTD